TPHFCVEIVSVTAVNHSFLRYGFLNECFNTNEANRKNTCYKNSKIICSRVMNMICLVVKSRIDEILHCKKYAPSRMVNYICVAEIDAESHKSFHFCRSTGENAHAMDSAEPQRDSIAVRAWAFQGTPSLMCYIIALSTVSSEGNSSLQLWREESLAAAPG
ncbi:hypothetical protein L9F63_005834, partial [Diploptera punctata]